MGVVVWFKANQDYIAKEFCENKDKPEMHCNGKCYLKKQLKKVDDATQGNQQQSQDKKTKTELPEFITSVNDWAPNTLYTDIQIIRYNCYCNNYQYSFGASIFHPPPAMG